VYDSALGPKALDLAARIGDSCRRTALNETFEQAAQLVTPEMTLSGS
jgi:hypothetical protein